MPLGGFVLGLVIIEPMKGLLPVSVLKIPKRLSYLHKDY